MSKNDLFPNLFTEEENALRSIVQRVARDAFCKAELYAVDEKRHQVTITELQDFIIDGLIEVFTFEVVNGVSSLNTLFNTNIEADYLKYDYWPTDVAASLCIGADPLYFSIIPKHYSPGFRFKRRKILDEINRAVMATEIPAIKDDDITSVHSAAFCKWALQRKIVSDYSIEFFKRLKSLRPERTSDADPAHESTMSNLHK